jgi:hypothetical protein
LYCNFSLGFHAQSECDKASRLGFGQNKLPSFGIHADSPPDSGNATVWAMERQQTGTCSNNPQRDQNDQSPHGYAEADTEARKASALFGNHRNVNAGAIIRQ